MFTVHTTSLVVEQWAYRFADEHGNFNIEGAVEWLGVQWSFSNADDLLQFKEGFDWKKSFQAEAVTPG